MKFLPALILALMLPSAAPAEDAAPGKQIAQEITSVSGPVKFWLWLPENPPPEGAPLLLFLHGAGERGTDLALVKKHGPPKLVEKMTELQPFIIVSPQCPPERWWDVDQVFDLAEAIAIKYKADRSRLYLTGLSMGGYATWTLTAKHPTYFAAAIPICGGGNPADAIKLKDLPLRVFHGAKDSSVPVQKSQEMVDALKAAGATDVNLTIFPDLAHESWPPVYADAKTYAWLLSKRKAQP